MKSLLILTIVLIQFVLIGQAQNQPKCGYRNADKTDTIPDLVIHTKLQGQTRMEIERGFFKVMKIDTLKDFYLIFIEKSNVKSTIYSEKCPFAKGLKINVDSSYYFELSCKDTISDGICLFPIANVTYFGKYLGYELGKLNTAKNLCGLIVNSSKESSTP